MKFRSVHILLIVALLSIIMFITTSDTVVPYSKDTLFSHMYKYEGFNQNTDMNNDMRPPILPGSLPPQDVPVKDPSLVDISSSSSQEVPSSQGPKKESTKDSKMVEGFALQPSPFGEFKVLDIFSKLPSGHQCFGQSSGYSNSLGPLCLDERSKNMLSNRGGNMSGSDFIIGN